MADRKLFANQATKILQISDLNGGQFVLPAFNKYEVIPLRVVILEPDTAAVGLPRFARVDVSNLSLAVALNDTYDDATPLAYQNTFSKDEVTNEFYGNFSLNTAALNTWLGSNSSLTAYFEIEVQDGTKNQKIYQAQVTVKNSVLQAGAVVPSPVDDYFTKAQNIAQFLRHNNEAGIQAAFMSPDGAYIRIIGCGNGGVPIDQILPV